MNENYQFYLHEAVSEDELRQKLADHDEVKHSTDDKVLEAWHYDTNNERGVMKGVQQWNLVQSWRRFLTVEHYISVEF